ncbi:hypothetical protein HXX76_006009 [Chlamydomonas incerta]|uniref:O-methyltransferase n=1 Tax=Chlamydomonas incerta TaxID=51695 RepID=A0A835W510_CHLIN|nr:hypothetical protein HXX76_006009 [Chlamydomonas incerta]|eukprot:KAG2437354.1 hypothetical protein HXX76_006009 [Chlamydomonas incerta]
MTRYDLGAEAERRGYKTGVELGVQTGVFAEHALRTWPSCVTYYLVDIWKTQENYVDGANVPQDRQEQFLADAKQRMQPFAAKAVFLRNFTSAAAPLIPDPVDFVYVDARHDYCGVVEDLTLYWPKVRSGGMMAGHDFIDAAEMNRINEKEHWEVCQDGTKHPGAVRGAVVEFFQRLGLAVHVTYRDGPWNSWMVIKP